MEKSPLRKKQEDYIRKAIMDISNGDRRNIELYEKHIFTKSNQEWAEFVTKLGNGELILNFILPNHDEKLNITIERLLDICKKRGIKVQHKITIEDPHNNVRFVTPKEDTVLLLPVRRPTHTSEKGLSTVKKHIRDNTTGQLTASAAKAKITAGEANILDGHNQVYPLNELLNIRGGDSGLALAHARSLRVNGYSSQAEIDKYAKGADINDAIEFYFNCMHLTSNL